MKKLILPALAATFVFGAASTAFATPTDEEVAELRARIAELERIIKEQQINSASSKEVENLDSRVSELEDKTANKPSWLDRFSIGGELRWSYWNRYKNPDASNLQLRILPTFKIDEHLTVRSRFRATHNTQNDSRVATRLDWAYVDARFGKFQINAGKMPLYTNVDRGLFADSDFSGVQVSTGDKTNFTVNLGRWEDYVYAGAEILHKADNFSVGVGYHYSKEQNVVNKEKVSVVTGGVGYKFTPDVELFGAVAHNSKLDEKKTAYNIELDYKGANRAEKGSWGAYVAYRYAPGGVARKPTYNTFGQDTNKKGFELGFSWTPYKNLVTDLAYFHGKTFDSPKLDDRTLFARARVFF